MRLRAEEENQARLKVEEEARIAEYLRLEDKSGGFCGAGVDR